MKNRLHQYILLMAVLAQPFLSLQAKDCRSLLVQPNGGESENLVYKTYVRQAIEDIGFLFPSLKEKIRATVVKSNKLIAQTDGNFCLVISEGFLDSMYANGKSYLSRGMLLFTLGHEIGHSILKHNSSCSQTGASLSRNREMSADAFGGFLIYALDESYDAPGQVFALIKQQKQNSMNCHGDPDLRDAMLLKNLGTIKYNARMYRSAMDKVITGSSAEIESGILRIQKVKQKFNQAGIKQIGVFDFAIASAYHRLWLMDDNEPIALIGQPSLYFPRTLVHRNFTIMKSAKKMVRNVKTIPGNTGYYYKARKYYKNYLRQYPQDVYAAMNINLLYMYDPAKREDFRDNLNEFQAFRVQTSKYLNNVGLMLLYDSIKNGVNKLAEAEYFLQRAYQKSHWESQDLFLQSRIIFNLAVLYKKKGREDKQREYTSLYLAHKGGNPGWNRLITNKAPGQGQSVFLPLQISGAAGYQLGMSKPSALRKIKTEKLTVDIREYYGYILIKAYKNRKPVYKFWFRKGELMKMTLYPASGQKIEGVMCGDSKKSIPEAFGVPVVQGNRLLFPGSNVVFKTEYQNNEIVIAQIEMRKID